MSPSAPVLAACFNEPYVPHVATMLRSVAASGTTSPCCYLVADDSVDDELMARLVSFAEQCGVTACELRIADELVAGFEDRRVYPKIAWFRSALAAALPREDRLLYLDSDLLVLHDLDPLWRIPLEKGDLFAAVCHPSYAVLPGEHSRLGLSARAPVFNSGVMLMDLARMRTEGFASQVREFAVSPHHPPFRYADQDAMNVLFAGRWTALDPVWNAMNPVVTPFVSGAAWEDDIHHSALVLERAALTPAIVHFDGASVLRPWHRRCFNPFASLYREYRATTPWPLRELDGDRLDAILSRIPPRLQAKLWHVQLRRAGVM